MTRFVRDPGFGAQLIGPDLTRFRLWAPASERAALEIEGRSPQEMQGLPDGWFEAEAACGAGTRYRYRVRPDLAVPDPAARAQADGVHGASVVVDPGTYAWRTEGWIGRPWREAVIYELHAGLLGGFAGVARRLAALKALGVTGVELMPVAEFPGARNWGYDGVLPYAPSAAYGGPDALKRLVDEAHALGLCVVLDVVYNHFGPDGNYLAAYAPGFFREDKRTPWGGAIDFRRPQVRRYFIENALYWLMEYRFDGLRFDAVHAIEDPSFLDDLAAEARAVVEPGRQIWLILENADNEAPHLVRGFDAQWNDDLHHALHVLLTGEADGYYEDYVDRPAEALAKALREGFIYQGQPSRHLGRARGTPSAALAPTAFVDCLQNHDQIGNRALGARLTTLAGPAALRAAVGLLLLSPHIPLLFMGEEEGARTPFLYFTDHGPDLAEAVREGRRKEFAAFPQFHDPEQRELIPDPNAPAAFEASRPLPGPDADEWRRLYADLLAFRRERIAPHLPGSAALEAEAIGEKAVRARWRLGDGGVLTLAANFGAASAPLPQPMATAPVRTIGAPPQAGVLPGRSFAAWLDPP